MPKLFPEAQPPVSEAFVNDFLQKYGLSATGFTPATSGIENATILVSVPDDRFVLRIYRQGKKSVDEIQTEIDFMEFLNDHDIPLPEVVRTAQGTAVSEVGQDAKYWHGILMKFVRGRHLGHFGSKVMEQLPVLQARIHNLGQEFAEGRATVSPTSLRETVFSKLLQGVDIRNPQIRQFLDRAETFKVPLSDALPKGWSHFDFGPDNILFDEHDRVVAVLDFDDTACMPLVVCLGYTLWDVFVTENSESKARQYLASYETVRTLNEQEKKLLPSIMLFRHYVVSSMDILHGPEGSSEEHILEQEEKIRKIEFS